MIRPRVATAAGVYDVIPAGEFQPASVALWDRRNDFDLWRNIVREYSEELLGTPEHDRTRTKPIDYEAWPLYRELEDAQAAGALASFVFGLGLDALTLAATILTVVVIDDDVFTRAFGAATRYNEEGEIVAIGDGRATEGIPLPANRYAGCSPSSRWPHRVQPASPWLGATVAASSACSRFRP